MVFGYIEYKIIGDNYTKLYKEILSQKIPCNDMTEIKGILYLKIPVEYSKYIQKLCKRLNLQYTAINKKGLFILMLNILAHKGLLIGGFVSVIMCVVLSNFIFRFNFLCDDPNTQKAILAVLKENGVQAGSYIPKLNLVQLERELKQNVDNISWAGISISGSTLTIDVVNNIEQPETKKIRMPCNLIAKYDAVIDKVEVFDGQLMTTVGSAVVKGDILVSGKIVNENITYTDGKENKDIEIKYVRSFGKVYGTFEQTVVIEQPFNERTQVISEDTVIKRYLKLFDLNIPLFLTAPEGNYISNSYYNGINVGRFEIPLGINTVKLNKYTYENNVYSKDEVKTLAKEKLYKYEQNYFKDYEIKDMVINETYTKDGLILTGKYVLYGDITKESEFFIEK